MRQLIALTLALSLVVGLAACDTAAPPATLADAKPSGDGFLVMTVDANGNSSERRQDKVAVCHYDDETATYKRISVGAPAFSAHLRHGDGVPGGEVPEAEATFGENCEVIPVQPFTCDVEYGTDELGRPTALVTAASTDPATEVRGGGAGAIGLLLDDVESLSSFPASYTIGFVSPGEPHDGIITLVLVDALFPDGRRETYFCGPYPIVPPV